MDEEEEQGTTVNIRIRGCAGIPGEDIGVNYRRGRDGAVDVAMDGRTVDDPYIRGFLDKSVRALEAAVDVADTLRGALGPDKGPDTEGVAPYLGLWDPVRGRFMDCDRPPDTDRGRAVADGAAWLRDLIDAGGGLPERRRLLDAMSDGDLLQAFGLELRAAEPPHTVFNVDEGFYMDGPGTLYWVTQDGIWEHPESGAVTDAGALPAMGAFLVQGRPECGVWVDGVQNLYVTGPEGAVAYPNQYLRLSGDEFAGRGAALLEFDEPEADGPCPDERGRLSERTAKE